MPDSLRVKLRNDGMRNSDLERISDKGDDEEDAARDKMDDSMAG